ncbi:MAG: hypothetical protein JXA94_04130 [Parachlamydiales bacterium]|nr:hypothetical protein [Parachlamydiales bacterium]
MKDMPSHMMKFMRKVTKKTMNEVKEGEFEKEYRKEPTTSKQNPQKVKQKKAKIKNMENQKVPEHLSVDEKNKKMKLRTPQIRQRSHKSEIKIK